MLAQASESRRIRTASAALKHGGDGAREGPYLKGETVVPASIPPCTRPWSLRAARRIIETLKPTTFNMGISAEEEPVIEALMATIIADEYRKRAALE